MTKKMFLVRMSVSRLSVLVLLVVFGFSTRSALAQGEEEDAANATFATVHTFDGTDGANPQTVLVQATNGDLYGTTPGGGANCAATTLCGTIFKISADGQLATLYSFCAQLNCADGAGPAALVQASNGDLYGTTGSGGTGCPPVGCGTVFKITPKGALTTLYNFCPQVPCVDGRLPVAGLIQATNEDLYGTTLYGGVANQGTIFKITPSGELKTLYSFCVASLCPDGALPFGGLMQATDGYLYGTTGNGGGGDFGTIFRTTLSGSLTTLDSLCQRNVCPAGAPSYAGLVQATDGNLYGTTVFGGIFRITPWGAFATVVHPCCTNDIIYSGLAQANNGDLYGITYSAGVDSRGTIFKVTLGGTFTTLHSFCTQTNCADGGNPGGALVQGTNGKFYGTTVNGGANGYGTVFALSTGLEPFVKTQPTVGKVGEVVRILGNSLIGATSITFNGLPATFTVLSATEIRTTVPTGATTGKVKVVTPSRTLTSNIAFEVAN